MKTGIFVGSFNPPTKAHFNIAQLLHQKFLEKIVFVPVNNSKKTLVSLDKRIQMLDIYTRNYDYLEVSSIMKNYSSNFNYKVLEKLSNMYQNIYIIIGADLLEKFKLFTNYQEMLNKYHFIVISRFGINCVELIEKYYNCYKNKFVIIDYNYNLSSSLVREKINKKENIDDMIYHDIKEYIVKEMLYLND